MAQPSPASPTYGRGMTSPSTPNDPPEVLPDVDPVASQWQRLASMDRSSPDFLPLLSSLIAGGNRSSTTDLRGGDAEVALVALDEILRDTEIPSKHEHDAWSVMRALAHNSGQVPPRYRVKPDILNVESGIISGGASSDIRKGRLGDKEVAVKTLKTCGKIDVHDVQKRFCKECIIWMNVSHPHILQLIAVDIDPLNSRFSMISEMMPNGNIKEYVSKNPPNLNRLCLLHEVAMGLHYLHEREIIHGDLKGHNILITNETPARACLADFGLSTLTPNAPGEMTTITAGGTPLYMAPELLNPEKFGKTTSRPTKPADMYAFGMVIYEVLTGFDPFHDKNVGTFQLVCLVVDGARPTKPGNTKEIGFGRGTWELVTSCWKTKPTKRPTIEQVLLYFVRVSASSTDVGPTPQVHTLEQSILKWWQHLTSHGPKSAGHHTHPQHSLNEGARSDSPDRQIVLSQWQHLGSLDPKSHSYGELLKMLVGVEGNMKTVLRFIGNDARIVINIIGEALKHSRLQEKHAHYGLIILRKLAGSTGQLPDGYLIRKGAHYQVEKTIFASGGFADIRKGLLAKKAVAVKTIRMAQDSNFSEIQKDFCKESVLWMQASHPNVLKLIAIKVNHQSGELSMISEFMGNGHIIEYIRMKEANRIRLLRDVARGLSYLHHCGIVHGDLKGTNILIGSGANPQACIADFGFSTLTPTTSFVVPESMSESGDEYKGTWSYMAPELLDPNRFGLPACRLSKQADIYAFGVVAYEVLTGRPLFAAEKLRQLEIMIRVIEGRRPRKPEKAGDIGFGGGTWKLVQQCWNQNRDERPTGEKVYGHFKRVVGTSTVVPPGPTISVQCEAEAPAASEPNSFRNFSRLFSSQGGMSIVQQVRGAADPITSNWNARSSFSAPSVQFIRTKPSIFERLGARIVGWGSVRRPGKPTSPSART